MGKWTRLARRAGSAAQALVWWVAIGPFCVASDLPRLGSRSDRALSLAGAPEQYPVTELLGRLLWFRGRLRLARAPLILVRGLIFCLSLLLVARVVAVLTGQPVSAWVVLATFLVAGWSLHLALHHAISPFEVARFVDRRLTLNAQLATAVEFTLANRLDQPLTRTQVRLATNRLREADPGAAIPMLWPGRDARILASVGVLYGLVGLGGAFGVNVPRPVQPIDQDLSKQAQVQAQALSPFVSVDPAQLPPQLATTALTNSALGQGAVTPQLQALNQQLAQQQISPAQYRADLQNMQQQVQQQAQQSLAAQEALNALAASLKDGSTTRGISDSLNQGDYQQAAAQLNALGKQVGQLSPQARQELAQHLTQAAQQTQKLNPGISGDASQAAQALQQGNDNQAAQSLQSLGKSVQQAGQQIGGQSQLGQQLQDVQKQLGGQNGSASQGAGNDASATPQGNGNQPGASSGPNGPPGSEDTQGKAGATASQGQNGNGADQSQGAVKASGPSSGTNNQASSSGGVGNTPGGNPLGGLTSSLDNHGVKLTIVGQASGDGNPTTQAGDRNEPITAAGASSINSLVSGSTVPSNVPINVHQDSNAVPPDMKPIVRQYFSNDGS